MSNTALYWLLQSLLAVGLAAALLVIFWPVVHSWREQRRRLRHVRRYC